MASRVPDDRTQEPPPWPPCPTPVAELLDAALVAELTVVDGRGRPVTYPLIPLWDGERVYMTSSTLFSRKLEHIDANAEGVASRSPTRSRSAAGTDRATIQGDARVIDEDPHGGWERLLPIWEAKEPAIVAFLKARVALPLFFERALIEITPRRVLYWSDGRRRDRAARDARRSAGGGRVMRSTPTSLDAAGPASTSWPPIPYQIATWVDDDGYPVSASPSRPSIDPTAGTATFAAPAGLAVPDRSRGLADRLAHPPAAGLRLRRAAPRDGVGPRGGARPSGVDPDRPTRAWGWDEAEVPFFEYSERSLPAVAQVLRRAVGGARHAGQAAALARLPDPARDPPAVPDRDDHPGRARHPHRREPRLLRPRRGAPDGHRRVVRPARAQRRQRRLRHASRAPTTRTSRRPSSAAARGSSSTGSCRSARWRRSRRVFYVAGRASIGLVLLATHGLAGAARHRRRRVHRLASATRRRR